MRKCFVKFYGETEVKLYLNLTSGFYKAVYSMQNEFNRGGSCKLIFN